MRFTSSSLALVACLSSLSAALPTDGEGTAVVTNADGSEVTVTFDKRGKVAFPTNADGSVVSVQFDKRAWATNAVGGNAPIPTNAFGRNTPFATFEKRANIAFPTNADGSVVSVEFEKRAWPTDAAGGNVPIPTFEKRGNFPSPTNAFGGNVANPTPTFSNFWKRAGPGEVSIGDLEGKGRFDGSEQDLEDELKKEPAKSANEIADDHIGSTGVNQGVSIGKVGRRDRSIGVVGDNEGISIDELDVDSDQNVLATGVTVGQQIDHLG